ncbi:MAG: DNA-processing protein DprA, partial [Clostridia bacterium]|nr:DNA-processing protein DprA [Clostridia bacterium]
MNNTNLWMWFSQKEHISKKIKYQLLEDFYDIENIYEAQYEDFTEIEYLKPEAITQLCDKECDFDDIIRQYKANNVTILTPDMEEYPKQLLATGEPPFVLYCRGKFLDLNKFMCVSVVGTRKMSLYGSNCAYNLSKEMAERGVVIVSGMAGGIDSRAHRGALDAGMPTVAVIGCGVNVVYPRSNTKLMKEIMETGMVISEYPLDTQPLRHHFPERNKIISGLSVATLVVEADIKSGSLITAKHSYEYGKDVFAVPGNIDSPFCRGTNYLIKDGAYL